MRRTTLGAIIFIMLVSVVLSSSAMAAPVPALKPGVILQDETGKWARDYQRIETTLAAYEPEKFKVLVVDSAGAAGVDAFLDQVWESWRLPPESVLLLVSLADGNKIRFYLGTRVVGWGVAPDRVIEAIPRVFAPEAAAGRPAQGVLALAEAIHGLISPDVAKTEPPQPTAPHGGTPGWFVPPTWQQISAWALRWAWLPVGLVGLGLMALSALSYRRRLRRWRLLAQARLSQSAR